MNRLFFSLSLGGRAVYLLWRCRYFHDTSCLLLDEIELVGIQIKVIHLTGF